MLALNKAQVLSLVMKYMSMLEFRKQVTFHAKHFDSTKKVFNALEFYNVIRDYNLKHNKNVTSKAFIDMADCFIKAEGKVLNWNNFNVSHNKVRTEITLEYKGNICIPFSECFIYTSFPGILGQVVEIKDNKDGTYSGSIYFCYNYNALLQAHFKIEPKETYWKLYVSINHGHKPLGQNWSNIGIILFMLSLQEEEYIQSTIKQDENAKDYTDIPCVLMQDVGLGLCAALQYLDFYKDKTVYKTDNIYVYGDDIKEYMEENYPAREYEKLNGWLIKGYWKQIKGMGKDQDGKPIKNLNWVIPYSNVQDEKVESNSQETRLVPIHAVDRAEQRYDIDLSQEDLDFIKEECLKGKCKKLAVKDRLGRIQQSKGKWGCYRINYKERILDFVLTKYGEDYRISTFLPEPKDPNYMIIDSKVYNDVLNSIRS